MNNTLFYRLTTDGIRSDMPLENSMAGPIPSACWLIGGGPSLAKLPVNEITRSPIPRMAINLSGAHLIRPTFWTSYDPSVRFHRSIYLDPGVMKFVHRRRATDLVPETTFKVCECPNLHFFDRDGDRGFHNFLSPHHGGIVDWADSMVQAIDILYQLGFRRIFLAGCEMRVRPSYGQIALAARHGVKHNPNGLLQDFVKACAEAGLSAKQLDDAGHAAQYHFNEYKPIRAAASTDAHYFRVCQYLRLSRRALALAGMQLISVTPHSRLNDHFPYRPARRILRQLEREIGNPLREPVHGLYRQTASRHPRPIGPMRDFKPHNWSQRKEPPPQASPLPRNQIRPSATPQRDGELLVEAEGFERLVPRKKTNGEAGLRELHQHVNRLVAADFSPREEG